MLGEVGQGDGLRSFLGDKSHEDLAIGGCDLKSGVFLADGEAGINDGWEDEVEVGTFVASEVGADAAACAFEGVAVGTK